MRDKAVRMLILIVLLSPVIAADEGAWHSELARIAAVENEDEALARIAELERTLRAAEPTPDTRQRLAELLVRCKVARVDLLAKGATSIEAIGLLEAVIAEEPGRVGARYTLARTCLALPEFFGRREQGVRELETLAARAAKEPGSVPFPDVFLLLADHRPERAVEILAAGVGAFPDHAGLKARLAEAGTPPPPAADGDLAKESLRAALARGELDYAGLDRALAAGEARHPDDPEYPLLRGLLRLWRCERETDATAVDEAIALFRRAMKMNPADTRIHGWLGPTLFLAGRRAGLPDLEQEGIRMMNRGVRLNPTQNLFGRALAFASADAYHPRVELDLYTTLELWQDGPMDRRRFVPAADNRYASPAKARFSREGFLHWAGDYFRSRGDTRRAVDAYEAALRGDPRWPFRDLAAARRDRLLGKDAPRMEQPVSCLLCHQERAP